MSSRLGARWIALCLACVGGCAQITTTHDVSIIEKRGAAPLVLGPPQGHVTDRGVEASWTQAGDRLEISLTETRRCAALRHEPVVRVDRITRKTGGALYWEYGIAGATLGLGLTALIRPDLFSQSAVNANGDLVKDLRSGYRVGGIFTAIGTAFLVAGIYDTVRARDETRYVDAYRVHEGEPQPCAEPSVPLDGQSVELIIGQWRSEEPTDADGKVRFLLPTYEELGRPEAGAVAEDSEEPPPEDAEDAEDVETAEAAEAGATPVRPEPAAADGAVAPEATEPTPPPPPPAELVKGVLRVDVQRAAAIDFVVPYDHPDASTHTGTISIAPVRVSKKQPSGSSAS